MEWIYTRVGTIERAEREFWTCILVILLPFSNMALRAFSTSCRLDVLLTQILLQC